MPLDAAEFISELSIVDPPGTDPLNQGDDHIRTTKRAVQQSFPNVNAAVPQTAAQMAQMAIKNEANTFTQINTFQQPPTFQNDINLDSGSTSAVSFLKAGVRQWQLLYSGTSENIDIRRYTGGVLQDAPLEIIRTTGVVNMLRGATFGAATLFADGSALAPSIAFSGQSDTGIYRPGTSIGFTVGGSDVAFMLGTQMRYVDGINAAPAYSFINQINSGMWRGSSTRLDFSVNGTHALTLSTAQIQSRYDGSDAFPAYAFASEPGTGFNRSTNAVNATANGVLVFAMSTNGMFSAAGLKMHVDGALGQTVPGWTFSNDSDTGVGRHSANIGALIAAGALVCTWGTGGFGITAGVPFFPSLPTTPGIGGSLWNDSGTVKVA